MRRTIYEIMGLVPGEYDALFYYRCCDCSSHADYGFRGNDSEATFTWFLWRSIDS